MERKQTRKTAIAVLAVLLALSFAGGVGTLLHRKLIRPAPAAPSVADQTESSGQIPGSSGASSLVSGESESADENDRSAESSRGSAGKGQKTVELELYRHQPEENTPFQAENLFPGDRVSRNFRVRVAYHDRVTLHYQATVRPGYEKLAEVLKIRVRLLSTGETLYDGRMRDMTESLSREMTSDSSAVEELCYEITAYLEPEVGNEYQNQALVADFRWWVEETENLDPSPKTGDAMVLLPWVVLGLCCGGLIFLLAFRRRREEEADA